MSILVTFIIALTIALLMFGQKRGWGYAPVGLCSLLFVVPIAMLALGFI